MFEHEPTWAITAYFDPLGSGRRRAAYLEFRRQLRIPLVTVELAFCGGFDLKPSDADVLIQVSEGDILWQKERLLNIALRQLPNHCDSVAWLDCDAVFARNDWAVEARRLLNDFALVQPFDRLYHLGPTDAPRMPNAGQPREYFDSFAARLARGSLPEGFLGTIAASVTGRYAPGLAWVARRSLIEEHGFYDAAVVGGGDSLMRAAACGHHGERANALRMSRGQREHYEDWAIPFYAAVQGRVSYVEGSIFHLWHGEVMDRRYKERHLGFEEFDFDPQCDIAHDSEGPWRWNSHKPELHAYVQSYFESQDQSWRSRRSDGAIVGQ